MNQVEFESEVARRMAWPVTPLTRKVLARWAECESPREADGQTRLFNRCWNPLATTYMGPDAPRSSEDIGFGPGKWNAATLAGVGIYRDAEAGIVATVKTLSLFYYTAIDRAMKEQAWNNALEDAFKTWIGSTAYSTELAAFFRDAATPPVKPDDAAMRAVAAEVFDLYFGTYWIRLLEQAAGLAPSSFGTAEQARVDAAVAKLRAGTPVVQAYADIGRAIEQAGRAIQSAGNARGGGA